MAGADDAHEAVDALIGWHIDFALRHRALIVVQDRDWQSLPPVAREQVRSLQREYVDVWAAQLRRLHRGLHTDRARAMAHAAFGLINSTPAQRADPRRGDARGAAPDGARRAHRPSDQVSDLGARVVGQREHAGGADRGVDRGGQVAAELVLGRRRGRLGQLGQLGLEVLGREAAQPQQHPRVAVDEPGHLEQHRERVDARVDPRAARAGRAQLAAVGQELDAGLLGLLDEPVGQLAGQQRRRGGRTRRRPPRRRRAG